MAAKPVSRARGSACRTFIFGTSFKGQNPDEIVTNFPQLTLADVHAALAYYWDNTQEIQQEMAQADALVEQLRQTSPSPLQEKLRGTDASGTQVSS